MHTHIETLAKNRRLNVKRFVEYAQTHGKQYLSDNDMVSTWDVNDLIFCYSLYYGEETLYQDRKEILATN